MAATPNYVGTPKSSTVNISTANTNRDGITGSYGTIHTAGANGARIDAINITATAATTAGMVRIFNNGALIKEVSVSDVTPSGTVAAWTTNVTFDPALILGASIVLKASTHNAESFNITITNGGDF